MDFSRVKKVLVVGLAILVSLELVIQVGETKAIEYRDGRQAFENELAMRAQLPELIAQARTDKALERLLLRMLINASLGSLANNNPNLSMNSLQSAEYPASKRTAAAAAAADGVVEQTSNSDNLGGASSDLTRLLESHGFVGTADDSSSPFGNEPQAELQMEYPNGASTVDKRGHGRPCAFNAITCVKKPSRRQ